MRTSKSSVSDADVESANDKEASQELDVEKTAEQEVAEQQTPVEPFSVFSKGMKIWIIVLVSISALISPFGAAMFLPALNVISDVLNITPVQVNVSLTTFMVCVKDFIYSALRRLVWSEYL